MDTQKAAQMAIDTMVKYGLMNERTNSWSFRWNRAKTICGQCNYGNRTIVLSESYARLNDEAEVLDTILHEIAHALVGPGNGHDLVWKLKAQEIGARPLRCAVSEKQEEGRFIGKCEGCGVEINRYRKPKRMHIEGWYSHTACKRAGKPAKITWSQKY